MKKHQLDFVLLYKTLQKTKKTQQVNKKLLSASYDKCQGFDAQRHMEGSYWLWKLDIKMIPLQTNQHWLHIKVKQLNGLTCVLTRVYRPPHSIDKHQLWNFFARN